MADTTTATYGFVKPGINDPAGTGTWGTKINADLDAIDTELSTLAGLIQAGGGGGSGGAQGAIGPQGPIGAQGPKAIQDQWETLGRRVLRALKGR
jgi:hypothetical protein